MIKTWQDRAEFDGHPFGDPAFWPESLRVGYMQQEINELRAALAERVPLSEEHIGAALKAACLRDTPESRKDMERAIKAAHNIKES